ncbi:MAG: LysR family transcriptional regulator [Rhodovibrionaceae bacterium]|nr:LysR family transcriptional regulator [Rhodovibrionaceae bacterium]
MRVLFGEAVALGPGKADLLEEVGRSGSISEAARSMKMSYRRAWLLIDAMNRDFQGPLVETTRGGSGGGGARLTQLGHEVLTRYRKMEKKAERALQDDVAAFQPLLAKTPKSRRQRS